MTTIVDFSSARPPVRVMKAANIAGAMRYVCKPSLAPKGITVPEASGYHVNNFPYGLVYEDGSNDFAGGAQAGFTKAAIAKPILDSLIAKELFDATRPVYCAVDCNLPQSAYQLTYAGIHAFCSTLKRPDAIYGPRPFLAWCEKNHGVTWLWELGSSSFNIGPEPANKRIQQLVVIPEGIGAISGVDYDTTLTADWGQFPAPAQPKPPTPKPVPIPTPVEDEVQIKDVSVTAAANGQGDTQTTYAFAKTASWSVQGGEGPHAVIAECTSGTNGNALVIIKGAATGQKVTVRLSIVS